MINQANLTLLEPEKEFEVGDNKIYKFVGIIMVVLSLLTMHMFYNV